MSTSKKAGKTMKKWMCMVLAMLMLTGVFFTVATEAATVKTVTRAGYVLKSESLFKSFELYGRDKFKVKYDGKKVVSCTVSQENKNLGTKMIEKGGTKLIKKTSTLLTYETKWYLNFSIMPTALVPIAKKVTPLVGKLANLGRLCTCVTTYTVDKNGVVRITGKKIRWQVPSKLLDATRKITSYFSPWF